MKIVFTLLFLLTASAFATDWREEKFSNSSYFIYAPAKTFTQKALMINLHGCAQKASDLAAEGNWQGAADKYDIVVVIPQVPGGGVIMGCWDYYGKNHTEDNRHNVFLIQLIEMLLKNPDLDINRDRVYISGLSSGGGEAQVIACLRPDLIRGLGLNSSPVLGGESSDISNPKITPKESADLCRTLAQNRGQWLSRQIVSIIVSDHDSVVNNQNSELIAKTFCEMSSCNSEQKVELGKSSHESLFIDTQGVRVSHIVEDSLGHNWAAGPLASSIRLRPSPFLTSKFISHTSMNYPLFLGDLISKNRR
jgi:poly(3-hydroxybutyrate) depolymerase